MRRRRGARRAEGLVVRRGDDRLPGGIAGGPGIGSEQPVERGRAHEVHLPRLLAEAHGITVEDRLVLVPTDSVQVLKYWLPVAAAIGGIGITEMRRRGYSAALATGLIAHVPGAAGVIPFVIIDLLVIVLLCIWPELAIWLPNKMIG